jgi:CheY-like chemotaxis protein
LKSYSNKNSESKRCNCQARILVVDDIEFNILPLKLLIKEHFDIDIEEATNGAIAVEMYKKGLDKPC